MKTYNCQNCSKVNLFKGYSYANKYCNNVCQKDYESKERVRQWLEEGKDWGLGIPKWVHRTLAELRGYACEVCGIHEHNGKPLKLECDHIDGNHSNNNIENLRLICPNCHSQTPTYKNRNAGNGRTYRRKVVQ
jgi:5-methylcytosine-specific restriction endonuclease McrA